MVKEFKLKFIIFYFIVYRKGIDFKMLFYKSFYFYSVYRLSTSHNFIYKSFVVKKEKIILKQNYKKKPSGLISSSSSKDKNN